MGRAALAVEKTELSAMIHKLESENTFTNPTELFIRVSETEWAKGICNTLGTKKGLGPSSVYQYVKKYGIEIRTKKGKKGRTKGFGGSSNRTSRGDKIANNPEINKAIATLAKSVPQTDNYKSRIDKIKKGSMKAAVMLNCQECYCFAGGHQTCNVYTCPLLPINMLIWPRKSSEVNNED